MFNGNVIEKTYVYDGSFAGLLTMVFDCYTKKVIPFKIVSQDEFEANFLEDFERKQTEEEKASRIFHGIVKNISYEALYNSYYAFLSNTKEKEINILQYLLNGFVLGPKIDTMLSIDFVFHVHSMRKKMLNEAHKLKGLLRFMEIGNDVFYASIHPSHNVLENVGQHFVRRLPMQNFIIHDKNRNLAFVYDTKEYQIVDASTFVLPALSEEEKKYEQLWKTFFTTIAIQERINPRLQMQFMPKKYWQDLTEFYL